MELPGVQGCFSIGRAATSAISGAAQDVNITGTDGLKVLAVGHLRFSNPHLAQVARSDGSAAALLIGWRTHGLSLLQCMAGDYAIACWNPAKRIGLVAGDRFATYPVYWSEHDGDLFFGARPDTVAHALPFAVELNVDAVHAYMYFHVVPAPLSIYSRVSRLDIGQHLIYENGKVSLRSHWVPEFDEQASFEFKHERSAFLGSLKSAVQAAAAGKNSDSLGCFLSGGTDSSTISGMACEVIGEPVKTFSIVFDAADYDERQYSRLAASHFRTRHTEHVLTPEEASATIDIVARSFEQPFGNSSAVPTHVCAALASASGVSRILGGDGGDELYGGNERYATQWLLSHYQRLPEFLRRMAIEPTLNSRGLSSAFWPVRKARGYVEQARFPMPERLGSRYNLLNRFGAENVFGPCVISSMAGFEPVNLEREVWSRSNARTLINRMLAYDMKFTLGDNDLPKVTRMCQAAGIDVAFPMLDDGVLAHSLRLKPGQKLKRTDLRHFFRNALRGYLPDAIVDKPKHGFGMPFGNWVLMQPRLAAMADDALASLATRGLIRADFISRLRREMSVQSAGYYGTMVWILMLLELWLRHSSVADFRVEQR